MAAAKFYITTPIYYPNGEPHLGHVYTTLAADTVARYHRLAGDDTFLLTGTDEHGIKMVKTAEAAGIEPRVLADKNVAVFQQVWKELHVTHDDFIRTSSDRHKVAVGKIVERLTANGDIYLGSYEGWYDEGQEEFVTETEAKSHEYKSAISGRPLVRYKEPTYFFRLTKYAARVLAHIESHPGFIQPETRRNEVLSKLRAGVDDLSVSRATLKWGIPMPHDPGHVLYVWIDALSNYITALGYGTKDDARFRRYWPADVHLIGKEIMWFHTVYWPAMLMSLGLDLPRTVFAHGWWTAEGKKMSKTLGNFIDLEKVRSLVSTYGEDAFRYYLLRAAPFGNDLDFTKADFVKAYNELANVLGNLLNRSLNMLNKYRGGALPAGAASEDIDHNLVRQTESLAGHLREAYIKLDLQQACLLPLELARAANGYIDATRPFSLAKDPAQSGRLDTVLNLAAQATRAALAGLLPVLPEKAAAGLRQLGVESEGAALQQLVTRAQPPGHRVGQGQPLFPRVDPPPEA
jgi:methionyl-tRNA synthetase